MVANILVAIDGSGDSEWAVVWAARLAGPSGARVIVLCAGDVPDGAEHLNRAADTLRRQSIRTEAITFPMEPAVAITRTAVLRNVDLVVIARHGAGGSGNRALGSVADAVVRRCPVPVLLTTQLDHRPDPSGFPLGLGAAVLFDAPNEGDLMWPAIYGLWRWMRLPLQLVALPTGREPDPAPEAAARLRTLAASLASNGSAASIEACPAADPAAAAGLLGEGGSANLRVLPVRSKGAAEIGPFDPLTARLLELVHQPVLLVRVESFIPLEWIGWGHPEW